MADEDIEAGGQTDDSDAGGEEPEADTGGDEGGERQVARDADTSDRPSRKERRANRMREANEAREAAIREAAELRTRVAAAEAAAQEAHRRIEERERQSQTTGRKEQAQQKIAALRRQAQTHLAMSAQLKGAEAQKEWDEFQRLQDEAEDARRELWMEGERERLKGEITGQFPNQALSEERQYFQAKYPWVATNVEGRALADGRFSALVAGGRPATRQTMEEAITYAAKILRLGGNGAPGPASRNAYVGTGQRDGEGDGGGQGGTMTIEDVRNNLALKRMALSLFKEDDEHVAYAKFAKQIGNKALRPD